MNWLRLSSCALALVAACDKTVPFENTAPAKQATGGGTTFPSIDGGFVPSMDASLGDGAMAAEIPDQPFTKAALLKQIADCSLARFREFNTLASALQTSVSAFAATPSEQTRAAAQTAWRAAMSSWEQAELFSFGPSGPSSDPGGQDLRSEIYYYPQINTCLMDQQIVKASYTNLTPLMNGLGALEYLLWKADAGNSCPATLAINAGSPSPWAKLDAATLAQRRADYAKVAADALAVSAKKLLDAWDPASGNYYGTFAAAGTPGNVYASEQAAFNAVNTAMFYIDKEFKDYKIAVPAGISPNCSTDVCPEQVESPYSQVTNDDLLQNLHAFRALFQGCGGNYTGLGFDDWLIEMGQPDIAKNMISGINLIQQQTAAFNEPLSLMVRDQLPAVTAMHANMVTLANILKGEYKGALNFTIPAAVMGDND